MIPPARVKVERTSSETPQLVTGLVIFGMVIQEDPQVYYAAINTREEHIIPCKASSLGGWIRVFCQTDQPGFLTVFEHFWPGWRAWIDGKPARLIEGEWLQLDVPPGEHQISFRYLPWDVPLGLALTLIGCGLAVRLWRKDSAREKPSPQVVEVSAQEHGCTQAEDGQDAAQHRGDD